MCGLFGWQFSERSQISNYKRAIISSVMALEMDKRGGDSFGLVVDQTIRRGLGLAVFDFQVSSVMRSRQLLGHTRKATIGAITEANAHPFEVGNIVGAHNGIVSNHAELNISYGRGCEVDSAHIFYHLAEDLPLREIEAYGAISFIKREEKGRVYVGKFNSGELRICGIGKYPRPEAVVWASTEACLHQALALAELNYFTYRVEDEELYVIEDGILHATDKALDFDEPDIYYDWRKGNSTTLTRKNSSNSIPFHGIDQNDLEQCDYCNQRQAVEYHQELDVVLCEDCYLIVADDWEHAPS
jgi:hypothetical protein